MSDTKKDSRPQWAKAADTDDAQTSRTDMWWAAPEGLKVAGIHCKADPKDPLYDDRIHLPLSEALVNHIDQNGVQKPLQLVARDGEAWVDDGRQRWRAVVEANKRRVARGAIPHRVRVMMSPETDAQTIFLMSRSLNAFTQVDGPLQIARNFKRAEANFGTTAEKYAASEDISVATLRGYVAMLDKASPVLLQAIESGAIDPTKAAQIARLPVEEQGAALETAPTATVEETRRAVNTRKAAANGETAQTRFSSKEVRAVIKAAEKGNIPHLPNPARTLLSALNGEALPDDAPAWLVAVMEAAGRS
jgi:ParB family chromosome partitioning protein